MGFSLVATGGTARVLERHGMGAEIVHKLVEGHRPNALDLMKRGEIVLVGNTPEAGRARADSYMIRRTAVTQHIPYYLTLDGVQAAVGAIEALLGASSGAGVFRVSPWGVMGRPPTVLVALDVPSLAEAGGLLDRLGGVVTGCKIGSQLFTAAGPAAIEVAHQRGYRVFLDLKFHDIPNTVAGAVREATRLGVFMLNVHASGGRDMMRAAAQAAATAAGDFGVARPLCLGVTLLTSLDRRALQAELRVATSVGAHVLHLADLSREAGLDGCVASPEEIGLLRTAMGARWVIATPGIRPAGARDDQKRTATPQPRGQRCFIVVGRPSSRPRMPPRPRDESSRSWPGPMVIEHRSRGDDQPGHLDADDPVSLGAAARRRR
jgi:orotidine-5'-phosphate decarboxylase